MNVLRWSGSPREIGLQHGEEFRNAIAEMSAYVYPGTDHVLLPQGRRLDTEEYLDGLYELSRQYAPDVADELDAIAVASGCSRLQVMALNAFLEFIIVRQPASDGGCTAFYVGPSLTAGKTYLGQNLDLDTRFRGHVFVAEVRADKRAPSLVVTTPGVLGILGLNSAGLGVAINFLHATDVGLGVCFPFLLRRILQQTRLGDAIGSSTIAERACGISYLVGTAGGLHAVIETTGRSDDVRVTSQGATVHTNHYLAPRLRAFDGMVGSPTYASAESRRGSTYIRQHIAERSLGSWRSIGRPELAALCTDHLNYPFSICNHCHEGHASASSATTVASVIMDLDSLDLFISSGSSHGAFHEVRLTDRVLGS